MAVTLGSKRRHSASEEKRVAELSRRFGIGLHSVLRNHHHHQQHHHQQQKQQQQQHPHQNEDEEEEDDRVTEWTPHTWTFDDLLRIYSKRLPVIVRATRGYYGHPGAMQLDVGQVWSHLYRCTCIDNYC